MRKKLTVINRPLSMSAKNIDGKIAQGYIPLTFGSDIVRPFHAFALQEELDSLELNSIIEFQLMGETFFGKFSRSHVEGLVSKRHVLFFEIVESAQAGAQANVQNLRLA